ncbi:MAG: DUF3794 domain-containing protein [Clostridia bacterium]|nr:DUF3794 domain-containing protein [Clostridia bacterium]
MQIEFKKEVVPLSEMQWSQSETLLAEGDVIVPDIKPDIREILLAEARSVITEHHISEGKLYVTGASDVHILYVPETEERAPKNIETRFEFKETFDVGEGNFSDVNVCASTAHIEFSLINSRKLNMKVAVAISARGYVKRNLSLLTDVTEEGVVQIKKKPITAYQVVADTTRELVIADAISVPTAKPDIDEIIKLNIKPVHGDCKIMSGKILLKGTLAVNTLYCGDDAERRIEHMEHEIMFSEMADIAGLEEDCLCHVNYSIKKVHYSVSEDVNGEARVVSLDIVLSADIIASHLEDVQVIEDCYSTKGRTNPQCEELFVDELLSEGVSHESIKEVLSIPEGMPAAGAVYSLTCTPKIKEIQIVQDKMVIHGKLAAFVLYGCAETENPMYSLVGEFDFEHAIAVDGLDSDSRCECNVTEQSVSFTLNAASEIELRCILEFYTRAMRKTKVTLLTGCDVEEESEDTQRRGMIIYFVQPGDSLWSIAKHYKTDQNKIMQLNKMDNTQIVSGQKLLIPGA